MRDFVFGTVRTQHVFELQSNFPVVDHQRPHEGNVSDPQFKMKLLSLSRTFDQAQAPSSSDVLVVK